MQALLEINPNIHSKDKWLKALVQESVSMYAKFPDNAQDQVVVYYSPLESQ